MQNVSEAYKEQMQKGIRNPSFLEIQYSIINTDAKEQAVMEDNGHEWFSTLDIKESDPLPGYLSFEPGRWRLKDKMLILPHSSAQNTGYVSDEISGEDGVFENPPTITITFTDPQTFYGYVLTFDEAAGEYPAEIRINGQTYYPDTVRYSIPAEILDVTQVVIEFVRSSQPYRRARLNSLIFGQIVSFRNNDLIKANFKSKIDFLSTALSTKSLSFTIDNSAQAYNPLNPHGLLQFGEERQPVSARFGYELDDGTVEWIPVESMTLQGTPTAKNLEATFTATDNLSILTGSFYKGLYRPSGITLYDLAVEVLEDAEVEDYLLDDHLKDVITKGPLPIATHKECLQIIANAGQCILYTDRLGNIRMEIALDPAITPYDSGHMFYSDAESAFNDAALPKVKYLDFLPGSWPVGDSRRIVLPGTSGNFERVGFVSEEICGADGTFANPPYYGMRFSFPYPSYSIPIVFDSIGEEYATDFRILYFRDGSQIDSVQVNGNASVTYTVEHNVEKADDIRLVIQKWSHGNRRATIDQIGGGRVNDYLLGLGDATEQPVVTKQAMCKTVTINCYNYTLEAEAKELYKETVGIDGQQTILQINHGAAAEITASMTGGTIVSQTHYTYQSIVTVSGTGELTLTGKNLVTTTTGVVRNINTKGVDKDALNNPLITDMENAATEAEWVADYFAKRNQLSVSYRGSPELDVYDLIYMESQFKPYFPVRLMEQTIDFNGGLSGKIKAVMA